MNSREALEKLINDIQEQGQVLTKKPNLIINFNVNISTFMDTIENAIKDLERLEQLEKENEILKKAIENSNKAYDVLMQNSNIQFLNQNQEIFKLKKVIEMLKNKLDIEIYEIHENGVTEYYLDCSAGEVIDEQKEYDLLKEWFENEK